MTLRTSVPIALLLAACVVAAAGCSRNKPTEPWPPNTDPVIFTDTFGTNVGFQAFGNSKLDALSIDTVEKYSGTSSLKFTVPNPGDPSGGYAGGAFVASRARSLAPYNALSFWVKASRAVVLETAGFGNDNTGTSRFEAKRSSIPMTTSWTRVLVPIPAPERLSVERGMFFVAEGPQSGTGLTFWIDDVEFVNEPSILNPRPAISVQTLSTVAGTTVNLSGTTRTTFAVNGVDQTVTHMPGYFDFVSSDPSVATVSNGIVTAVGAGSASITGKLGSLDATGSVTLNVIAPPAVAAPTPTLPASSVISIFSNAYTNVPVDNWRAFGSPAVQYQSIVIAGNDTKLYTNLAGGYVGIEFKTPTIDASAMTHFHLDVWAPTGANFKVKLVDFGADGVFGGNNDTQHELAFDAGSTPPFTPGGWVGMDIPLANFLNLTSRSHLAQLILSGDTPTVFVDNIYLHQ